MENAKFANINRTLNIVDLQYWYPKVNQSADSPMFLNNQAANGI